MHKWPCVRKLGGWFLILFLLAAIFMWILNSTNIIQGNWATIVNALCTGIGTLFAFLQYQGQATTYDSRPARCSSDGQAEAYRLLLQYRTSKRIGEIVVLTPRTWRGTALSLRVGLDKHGETNVSVEATATVTEYVRGKHRLFQCFFPAVPPGHYTLVAPFKRRYAQVIVSSGDRVEIDWR